MIIILQRDIIILCREERVGRSTSPRLVFPMFTAILNFLMVVLSVLANRQTEKLLSYHFSPTFLWCNFFGIFTFCWAQCKAFYTNDSESRLSFHSGDKRGASEYQTNLARVAEDDLTSALVSKLTFFDREFRLQFYFRCQTVWTEPIVFFNKAEED